MGGRTSYIVDVDYRLNDKASGGLDGLGRSASRAESNLSGVKDLLLGIGAAFTVDRGIEKGKEMFISFNAEMESMRISAAAMLQSNDLAKSFEQATEKATAFTAEFQRFAITSPVTTKQLFEFSNGVSTAVAQAGGSIKDIVNVTEQGVIAAKAFGAQSDYAALELTEGIQRGATARMRFIKQLIATQHMSVESFNKLSETGRLDTIERALNSPAMKSAAKAFGDSFTGVLSTFDDNLQLLGGRIGLPLFKAITAEVKSWNDWLSKNPETIEAFGKEFSHDLMVGFTVAKNGVTWIVDHKGTLIAIAEAYAAIKAGGIVGDLAGGLANSVIAAQKAIAGVETSAKVGTAIAKNFTAVVMAAGLGVVIAKEMTDYLDRPGGLMDPKGKLAHALGTDQAAAYDASRADLTIDYARRAADAEAKARGFGASSPDTFKEAQSQLAAFLSPTLAPLVDEVHKANAFSEGRNGIGQFDPGAFRGYEQGIGEQAGDIEAKIASIQRALNAANMAQLGNEIFGKQPTFDPLAGSRTKPAAANVNVYVKQEIATNDPDRFAQDFTDACARITANPTQTRDAFRGF